jgi:hypothetical protein
MAMLSAIVCLTNLSCLMNDQAFFSRLLPSERARLFSISAMLLQSRNMLLPPNWGQTLSSLSDMFYFDGMIERYKYTVMAARKMEFIHTHLSEAEALKLLDIAKRRAHLGILLRGNFDFCLIGYMASFEWVGKNGGMPLHLRLMCHGACLALCLYITFDNSEVEYVTSSEAKSILVDELRSHPDGLQKSIAFWTVLGSGWEFLFGGADKDGSNPTQISCGQIPSSSLEKASLQLATRRDPALFIWTQCALVSLTSLSGWLVSSVSTTLGTKQESRSISSTAVKFLSSMALVSAIRYFVETRKGTNKRRIALHASQICLDVGKHGYKLSPWSPAGWSIFFWSAVCPLCFQTPSWPQGAI